ncbi:hypothetical protein PVL29_011305 [Vitis rotundifolia]|uniref:non-specific serine/threonine protein kinase n=1 Tax=Vitis rotundifolia TaxID=103349 RepID=A0AA38ZN53_VITRO|nr:hypothetical protein PVL29_011305 [Vitis rotundifolia]
MEHSSMFGTPDRQLMTVRSFPEGTKNYNKYLIRASFMYGNYDSKNQLPEFKLYLGVDEWDTVKLNNSYDIVRKEIIHVPRTGHIDVCLVNTGSGSPFISALELRQLNNSIYTTQSGSLILFKRLDIGSTTSQTVRYKDDAFDRVWEPFCRPYWKSVSASYSSDSLSDNPFKPPSKIMATALTPADERYPLEFHWNLDNSTRQFYVYMHFAEVEELQSNQLRELYVSLNGWFLSPEPIVPGRLVPHTGFSTHSISASSELSLSIFKTHRSTLPPIFNALEIYEIKQLFQSSTVQINVDAIKKIKAVYNVKKNWQGDPCLPIEFSWNGLSCSDNSPISPSIISLNLSWSKLTGEIDSSFSNLTSLKSLDLSYNSLTGEVPNFLSKLPSLKTLNLSGNNLTGSVPLVLIEKSRNGSLSLRLDGNPNLCKKNSCEDEEEENKEKTNNNVIVPSVAFIISVLVLLLGEVAALWISKRRQQYDGMTLDSMNPRLSYSEVNRITGNFKKLLDQGAAAKVYLGHLSDDTEVAVKMLTPSSVLVFKQFKTEAQRLTRVHHKNLVSLIGYCEEGSRMVLVYEHMAKGNLKEYLSGKNEVVLSWEQRLRIAIDAAQALQYLHDGCNPPIIHGDVKTENILLNEKFQAKVADFGWSRSMPSEGGSYASTAIVGTLGYVVPEYNRTSVPSKKTDVYSFGIVLLELISGRPAIIKTTEESPCDIADWVHQVTAKGDIKMIVDPRLQGEFEAKSARRAVETAISCVPLSSIDRPTMSHVVLELKECLKIAIAHEKMDNAEEDQGPVGIEAVHERTDKVEEDHDPFGGEAAYERTDDAEEDQGPLGVEAAHEVTDSAKEGHGPVGIGAAHERHDDGKEDHGPVRIEAADEIIDNAEVDQGPFGIEATQERTDNVEVNHGPVGIEAAHERTDDAEEDHGPVGIETTQERTDNVEEDHGLVRIEAAHYRNDNVGEDHNPVGIEAAHERTDNVEENLGPVGIESAHEGTDDAEEDQGPDAIEASQERTDNVEENHGPVGIEAAHERNDNVAEDHGPDGIEVAHERTDNVEEDNGPLGIESAMAVQERNLDFCWTNSYGKAKEMKEKKKNVVVSPVASITSVVVPSDIVVKPNEDDKTFEPKNQHLTYSEVERITENFQKELGKGASAIVYHGHLSNGTEVAVKKLSPSSILGSKQFKTEAQLLTRVHHKNLVSLVGYCDEGSNLVLIYEYMAKGNLKAYLSGKTEAVLSWEQRLRIAIDAAQALEYLHNGCNPPIIHRDVKTENILLNEKLQAKVADFGWSKSMPVEGGSYVSTAIVGTPGYLYPEYHRNSVPNEKTDVYSYGIVLLELISSRPAIIKITGDSTCNITNWVRLIIAKGDIRMIVDPRLQGKFETNSARRAIETAMSCVSFSSTDRPTMSDIIVELRECLKIAMTHERTKEGNASVGIEAAMAVQESFDGNQDFLMTGSNEKAEEKEKEKHEKKKKKKKNFIGPAVTSITSVLGPSGALASLGKSKKKWPQATVKSYSYSEVARITNNFQQVIGCGPFGSVYLGYLSDGTEVAVKLLSSSIRGSREFQTEAQLLARIRHKNLVSLHGYHDEGSSIALIYEYMVKGSLTTYLSDENEAVLSWKQRIGIALDVAQGLEYLHDGCKPPIIHRDVKSANILLNEKLQAKVAGMGLSRSLPIDDLTHASTMAVCSPGCLDPEYHHNSRLSKKTDVYSFGIVLLELVSGQPAVIRGTKETIHLVDWVQPLIDRGEFGGIVDPRLNGDFDINSARKAVETAMACVRFSSVERPTMSDIAYELKECVNCLAIATGDVEEDLGSIIEDAMLHQPS